MPRGEGDWTAKPPRAKGERGRAGRTDTNDHNQTACEGRSFSLTILPPLLPLIAERSRPPQRANPPSNGAGHTSSPRARAGTRPGAEVGSGRGAAVRALGRGMQPVAGVGMTSNLKDGQSSGRERAAAPAECQERRAAAAAPWRGAEVPTARPKDKLLGWRMGGGYDQQQEGQGGRKPVSGVSETGAPVQLFAFCHFSEIVSNFNFSLKLQKANPKGAPLGA